MVRWFTAVLERLVQLAFDLAAALVRGLLGAPGTAVRRALGPVDVRQGRAEEVVDVRHRVLREGRPREAAIFEGDTAPGTRHWVASSDDRIVGVVTVIRAPFPDGRGPSWQLRGMAVLPEWQGSGLGRALLEQVHVDVAEPMWCNAREKVEPFYARHGWRAVGGPFDIPGVGPHVRMVWAP